MRYAHYFIFGAFGSLLLVLAIAAARTGIIAVKETRQPWERPLVERDLDSVLVDTLRVLVLEDPLSYETRPKAVAGLEYDLLVRFAKSLKVPLRAIPMVHPDSMLLALQRGQGDIIAAQATPRKDRRRWVAWSKPYRSVYPVLATLRADPQVEQQKGKAVLQQRVDTAEVSLWSPFAIPEYAWKRPAGSPMPVHVDASITPEDLLMEVLLGRHGATVVTDARARYEAGRFPVLEFSAPLGPEVPLCFVLRRNAPQLKKRLDAWLTAPKEVEARSMLVKAYSVALPKPGPLRTRKTIPMSGDSISPFDEGFREHAANIPWDWELLAAMAYKESRFDSTVTSGQGAQGIMQIMPRTGEKLGLRPGDPMEEHIAAATRYLNKLDTFWVRAIPDREQRLRFVLASYNAGPGHIVDAQRLADRLGLDPDRWEHNVERAILLLAKPRYYLLPEMKNGFCNGRQVFHYVREVLSLRRQLKGRPRPVVREERSSMPESAGE
ncbi:MAG: transporter substrate-binding domain-containing protein [Flavobacteriales bacterium]